MYGASLQSIVCPMLFSFMRRMGPSGDGMGRLGCQKGALYRSCVKPAKSAALVAPVWGSVDWAGVASQLDGLADGLERISDTL